MPYQCLITCYRMANASCWLLLLQTLMIMVQFRMPAAHCCGQLIVVIYFYFTVAVTVMLTLPLLTSLATVFFILVYSQHYDSPPWQHLVPFPVPHDAVSIAPVRTAIFAIAPGWLLLENNFKTTAAVADTVQCIIANATAVLLAVVSQLIVVFYFFKESCYALAAMLPTPLTLLLLPAVDYPFTHMPWGHSCRQCQCYYVIMLLPLSCISVLYSCCLLDPLFTIATIAIALASIVDIVLAIIALTVVALTSIVLPLLRNCSLPSMSFALSLAIAIAIIALSLFLSLVTLSLALLLLPVTCCLFKLLYLYPVASLLL